MSVHCKSVNMNALSLTTPRRPQEEGVGGGGGGWVKAITSAGVAEDEEFEALLCHVLHSLHSPWVRHLAIMQHAKLIQQDALPHAAPSLQDQDQDRAGGGWAPKIFAHSPVVRLLQPQFHLICSNSVSPCKQLVPHWHHKNPAPAKCSGHEQEAQTDGYKRRWAWFAMGEVLGRASLCSQHLHCSSAELLHAPAPCHACMLHGAYFVFCWDFAHTRKILNSSSRSDLLGLPLPLCLWLVLLQRMSFQGLPPDYIPISKWGQQAPSGIVAVQRKHRRCVDPLYPVHIRKDAQQRQDEIYIADFHTLSRSSRPVGTGCWSRPGKVIVCQYCW